MVFFQIASILFIDFLYRAEDFISPEIEGKLDQKRSRFITYSSRVCVDYKPPCHRSKPDCIFHVFRIRAEQAVYARTASLCRSENNRRSLKTIGVISNLMKTLNEQVLRSPRGSRSKLIIRNANCETRVIEKTDTSLFPRRRQWRGYLGRKIHFRSNVIRGEESLAHGRGQ